jgi:biopolymer transport protein ExbD
MRLPAKQNRTPVGANMTPMIDVVFLLIIFFLVSSHLARQETQIPLSLPLARTGTQDDPEVAPLTIHVDSQSRLFLGTRNIDPNQLREILRDYLALSQTQPRLRIRTDRKVPYETIEPILKQAAISGIPDVRVAVSAEPIP